MKYAFDMELAKLYGVDEAVMIENLFFWIKKNMANNKHFYDGRYWTYNSKKAFSELFPFWTERQIRRIINNLKNNNVIFTGNYNKINFDRTTWYALSNKVLAIYGIDISSNIINGDDSIDDTENNLNNSVDDTKNSLNDSDSDNINDDKNVTMHLTKTSNQIGPKRQIRLDQNVRPIPDINTDINTDINKNIIVDTSCNDNFPILVSNYLIEKIIQIHPNAKIPTTRKDVEKWAVHINRMIKLDHRSEEDIKAVLKYATTDLFWQSNILSTKKLRDKFDTLFMQMKTKKPKDIKNKLELKINKLKEWG